MSTPLPIDPVLPELLDALRSQGRVVLVAPPGSGKTTRVPPAILRSGLLDAPQPGLVLLQPRRVAARAAACRIAEENGWTLGAEVGFQTRVERCIGPRTLLRVQTEGILNRQLLADPFLEGIGAVVLDEFHERSLHTDLAVALLREIRESVRDDLRLVVMSATLDAEPIARYLGDCPVVCANGRRFPVDIVYRATMKPAAPEAIADAVADVVRDPADRGHVLVFLPGADEIRRAGGALETLASRENLDVVPLHGSLSSDDQDRALRPSERRKVILATNVAETSLTIDGVTTVIDSGLARFASMDPARGLDRLELGRISRASADQRAGRAGRTGPGRCVRLWAEREQRGRDATDPAEIARADLAATILALHAWGTRDASCFGWFEPPPAERVAAAERLLTMLGALDEATGAITPLGRRLLNIPAHPRIARLLVAAADEGHPHTGARLAAILSEKDLLLPERGGLATSARAESRHGRGASDLLLRLDLLAEAERDRFAPRLRDRGIDPLAARRVARSSHDFLRAARRGGGPARKAGSEIENEPEDAAILCWILLAYPDRVARRRPGDPSRAVMVGGRGVRLLRESVVRDDEFFIAVDPREERRAGPREAIVRIASAIDVSWLESCFPASLRRERTVEFDPERQRPAAVTSTWYRDLLLREDRNARVDPAEASAALARSLQPNAAEFVRGDEHAAAWLARLDWLRETLPESDWPAFTNEVLGDILVEASHDRRTLDELRRVPLVPLLRARLTYAQARALEELAPEALAVPSGSKIRLTYEPGRPPVLAVRLQEVFGWTETPRLAGGRVPVLLHLLGPNFRPVQVTDDLKSFWATTYFQVRKDLRARYPRHAWPDDPLSARPEARGGRRR